ncbi:MAG TPA: hypothetical protein VNN79_18295, partial [Actinomycetota bacterium]|nr:hypothetical protein [Actinomycetota bacterium]
MDRHALRLGLGVILAMALAVPVDAVWHVGQVPFTLNLGNHTSSEWLPYIEQAAADWSQSTVLDIAVTSNGKLSVYNGAYGTNYPASWTTLTYGGGYTKTATISLNDSWLAGFTPDQRQHAICAEIGNAISNDEGCRDRVTGEWFTSPTQQDFDELV